MPLPPSFSCPVCHKKKQRGLLGVHLTKHSKAELLPFITNLASIAEPGWHPQLNCSDHTYIICMKNAKGFEKDKPLHKSHDCNHSYTDWSTSAEVKPKAAKKKQVDDDTLQSKTMQEVIDICKERGIGGYSGLRKGEIIKLIEAKQVVKCDCHNEITQLRAELETYKKWKHTLLTCMPGGKYVLEPEFVVTIPTGSKNQVVEHPVLQTHVEAEVEAEDQDQVQDQVQDKDQTQEEKPPTKTTVKRTFVSKASKKEIEKGMWCTRCESCHCVAQYTKDLKACGSCHKLCHFNDDIANCYLWDCVGCNKTVCKECNKAAGGNRLNPYCSKACAATNIME